MSRPVDPRLFTRAPATRRLVLTLATLQLIGGGLIIAQAILLADVVAVVFTGRATLSTVLGRLVVLALVGIARAALAGAQEWLTGQASVRVRAQLRRAGLQAVVRLGPSWAQRQTPGYLVTATGPGLDALDGYVTRACRRWCRRQWCRCSPSPRSP